MGLLDGLIGKKTDAEKRREAETGEIKEEAREDVMMQSPSLSSHHAAYGSLALLMLVLGVPSSQAERYANDLILTGTAFPSEHISGFRGTAFELGIPDSESQDEYAIFGITSEERKDHPCYVSVKTENMNDASDKTGPEEDALRREGAQPGDGCGLHGLVIRQTFIRHRCASLHE